MTLKFYGFFQKILSTKFHENPSSGNLVACGRTDRQTDGHDAAIVVFCNAANAPKWQTPRTKIDDQADIEQCWM